MNIKILITRIAGNFPKSMICLLVYATAHSCTTHYYVVRHAEKRNNSDTSTLTIAGTQRAEDLKNYLLNKNITGIYASVYQRTQLTARPLSVAINKTIGIYQPDTTLLFAEKLRRMNGSRVLVVGHSDNIATIVQVLSGDNIPLIGPLDFDNLYIIKVVKQLFWTSRTLTHTTYGVASP